MDIVDIYVDILLLVISYFLDNERGGKRKIFCI